MLQQVGIVIEKVVMSRAFMRFCLQFDF